MHFGDDEQFMRYIRVGTKGSEDDDAGVHRLEGDEILHSGTVGDFPKNKCSCLYIFNINRVEKQPFCRVQDETLYVYSEYYILIRMG